MHRLCFLMLLALFERSKLSSQRGHFLLEFSILLRERSYTSRIHIFVALSRVPPEAI